MAGGTFDRLSGKIRPGTYANFESTRQDIIGLAERGVVLLPLIGHNYGPEKEFFSITAASIDAERAKLGYSVYDQNHHMLLIRECFKNARKIILYIPKAGTKARYKAPDSLWEDENKGELTITARYGGSRGNDISVSSVANPLGGYDVAVHLEAETMAKIEGVETVDELAAADCDWIDVIGNGPMVAFAGVNLSGGTDGVVSNSDITQFLDDSEGQVWNTMAFPLDPGAENALTLYESVKTKIKYLRENVGKYRKVVLADCYADYEGVINVTNSVELTDGNVLTPAQVTAWVAGVDAGASNTTSNTNVKYNGAVKIIGEKNHEASEEAVNQGEFFFSWSEEGAVVVEYDINSLITFEKPRDKTYRKNRVLRVFDTFGESVKINFPPNRYDNSPTGWDVMEGIGKAILQLYEDAGAIKNVDYDSDFLVDREASSGDETYFNVGLEPVDSAEKLYFTIKTR